MNLSNLVEKRKQKNIQIRFYVEEAKKTCNFFFNTEYIYSKDEAIEELGIEAELIDQLTEDFVIQIIYSNKSFRNYLDSFKILQYNNTDIDFTDFRELVHKNLGVARNLRIKDSEKILKSLMDSENLEEMDILLDVLEACAVILHPMKSFDTLQIINLKDDEELATD